MPETILELRHWIAAGLSLLAIALAGSHAVMWKRDSRAALGWLALILTLPIFGALAYFVMGINRMHRKVGSFYLGQRPRDLPNANGPIAPEDLEQDGGNQWVELARFVGRVTGEPLYGNNLVQVYENGGAAFGAMLEAIDRAQSSVALQTYIFDSDEAGNRFRQSLVAAHRRGVKVRVLIDAVGDRYSWPPMHRVLCDDGLDAKVFRPTRWPKHMAYANLRNHRKLLLIDGTVAFTGGMNIRVGHWVEKNPEHPIHDLHFSFEGPVVSPLQRVFAEDWAFASGQAIDPSAFFPNLRPDPVATPEGNEIRIVHEEVAARIVDDGPSDRLGHMRWTFLGGLSYAQERVRIATPYFLPDDGLLTGLATAARRGVEVEILIPEANNLLFVQWASMAIVWQVLGAGCRIILVPPPFDHSKVMLVDDGWAIVGSANWDARSLRLNFELDVECYSESLTAQLHGILDRKKAAGRELTLSEVDSRPWPIRLRDGIARLFIPYL